MSTQIPVWMSRRGGSLVLRPEGPCTFCICATVDAALIEATSTSPEKLYIDLSRAEWLDSTFTGYLVSLITRKPHGPLHVHLVAPSESARSCLEQMHVLELFEIDSKLDFEPSAWEKLVPVEVDSESANSRLIESHEHLVAADTRNAARFGPVVKLFRAAAQSTPATKPTH